MIMKKTVKSILSSVVCLLAVVSLYSCFGDDSKYATNPLSDITISGQLDSIYNINKNDTLVISPVISMANQQKECTYTWEINGETYSHDKDFVYVGNRLGKYLCRLVVENEDGKAFHTFTMYVNSPYEEGITVISTDPEGRSMLSFMLTQTDTTIARHFEIGDCFAKNNPDVPFASNIVDMVQTSGSLILCCQGDTTGRSKSDIPTFYYLNEKTFAVENILTAEEFSDFVPTHMMVPSVGYQGVSYIVLCKNGKAYEFSTTEGALTEPKHLQSNYAQSCITNDDGSGLFFEFVVWDNVKGALCEIYSGYGPFYCGDQYHLSYDQCNEATNYFTGCDLIQMLYRHGTSAQKASAVSSEQVLVIAKKGNIIQKSVLGIDFWRYSDDVGDNVLDVEIGKKTALFNLNTTFTADCPAIAGFYNLYYGSGNQVYSWTYVTNMLSTAKPIQTVGSADAIITGFEFSEDLQELYVAFYEPNQTGLNGSVWVLDPDNGAVLRRYDNVCYKPTKIMYKVK